MANNRTMTNTEVLKIILYSAKLYRDNLVDKNMIIIIYDATTKLYSHIETVFYKRNFLHLTGVQIRSKKGAPAFNPEIGGATDFYELCLINELKITDFKQAFDGTTPLKISVLSQLMTLTGNLLGDFNYTKNLLITEKLVGNIRGCMGFVEEHGYYIPNTLLKDDIRDVTYKTNSVVCILEKLQTEDIYNCLKFYKKGKAKKKKIKGKVIVVPAVNHVDSICQLDIVKDRVDVSIFNFLD